jgi:DNA polymerase III delta subunit
MIYLLYGRDGDKARKKLHELVESLLKKKPDASHVRMNDETFSEQELESLLGSMGLFSNKAIIELDNIFRNKDSKQIILEKLKEIASSENIFVFLEGELNKTDLTKFEKNAQKVQEFKQTERAHFKEVSKEKDFNIFSLTDALGKKDKKQLWVLFQKATMKNISPEEIHGILFWQIKALLLATESQSAKEAGLNPFVFQKSQGFARNFSLPELRAISSKLVELYHQARRGIIEFETGLERFILEM